MARPLRYGEPTEPLRFRLPQSKLPILESLGKGAGLDTSALLVSMLETAQDQDPADYAKVLSLRDQLNGVQQEFQAFAVRSAERETHFKERADKADQRVRYLKMKIATRWSRMSKDGKRRALADLKKAESEVEQLRKDDAGWEADEFFARIRGDPT